MPNRPQDKIQSVLTSLSFSDMWYPEVSIQSGSSYEIDEDDVFKTLYFNGETTATLNIPLDFNTSDGRAAFPTGTEIYVSNRTLANMSITTDEGVTITAVSQTIKVNGAVVLKKISSNLWSIDGGLVEV